MKTNPMGDMEKADMIEGMDTVYWLYFSFNIPWLYQTRYSPSYVPGGSLS